MKIAFVSLVGLVSIAFMTIPSFSDEKDCYSYIVPTCPVAKKCSDTLCDVPSESEIDGSSEYTISSIGLIFGGNPAGVLYLRPQDMGCKPEARWDESHSVITDKCVLNGGGSGSHSRLGETGKTTECYIRKKCETSCSANSGEYSAVRTMTKGENHKQYILPLYRCSSENTVEDSRIASEVYTWCDNTTVCPEEEHSRGN